MTELDTLSFEWNGGPDFEDIWHREWLVTNGLGGYASGSLSGCNTRRYHGLFIPSLPAPFGRTVMLPRVVEHAHTQNGAVRLDGEEWLDGTLHAPALPHLRAFRLRGLVPEWDYELNGTWLRRKITMVHGENTVFLSYEHLRGPALELRLRPFPLLRFHDRPLPHEQLPSVLIEGDRVEMRMRDSAPGLRLRIRSACASPFVALVEESPPLLYRIERSRGLDHSEVQISPGYFQCQIRPEETLTLVATVQEWDVMDRDPAQAFALEAEREHRLLEYVPAAHRNPTSARLVLASDQFVIEPSTRPLDEAWARAAGQHARSVIAGYHWFTDWGRDTMISLEGLTLVTGRWHEAGAILRTFLHHMRDGLIPNLFPEGGREGLYHTADATMWFFHAMDRYLETTGNVDLLAEFFPKLQDIISRHLTGTRFGIAADPSDGLLRQGEDGYQLTWMDAKVDGWVVTPRRGKAVEINALWINALRLMAEWSQQLQKEPYLYLRQAEIAQSAFNQRFWNPETGCLRDIVDAEGGGDDNAIRPNQIFAISLKHPALDRKHWRAVLEKVEAHLLTPVGLRTLSPSHPDYKPMYDGDLRARDAAYHQGTVWAWLIGHFVDAKLRTGADKHEVRQLLRGLEEQFRLAGLGQISEIYDATPPYRPRGCIAQAWSVAEFLRAWLKTE